MTIVITFLFASGCFWQGQQNVAKAGTDGNSALQRKATPRTVSALALGRRRAKATHDAANFALVLGNANAATPGTIAIPYTVA